MMFFTTEAEKKLLARQRQGLHDTGVDGPIYFDIGYFMMFYAAVEIRITFLLARATNMTDKLEAFELLTYGLDAKAKVIRLKRAAAKRIGPNLAIRLDIFHDHLAKLRNRVAHSYPVPDEKLERIGFVSLNQFPSFTKTRPPTSKPAVQYSVLEFFENAVWLNLFNNDLKTVRDSLAARGLFEIDHPTSPLPQEQNQSNRPTKTRATPSRRDRKRHRKGLLPRATE